MCMWPILIFFANALNYENPRFLSKLKNSLLKITGIKIANNFSIHPLISITMGTITAVFGGLIRDVLYNEIPVILHKELYATLCITGGLMFFFLKYLSVPLEINYSISMLFIIITRVISIKYNLSLKSLTSLN